MNTKVFGDDGEVVAKKYLENKNYKIIESNWRPKVNKNNIKGEIDIIAYKKNCLVIVEVKTRKNYYNGTPVEAINWHKYNRLRKLSALYIQENDRNFEDIKFDEVRIDAIGIVAAKDIKINHIKGIYY